MNQLTCFGLDGFKKLTHNLGHPLHSNVDFETTGLLVHVYVSACHITKFALEAASLPLDPEVNVTIAKRMNPCSQFLVYCKIASTDC